MFSVDDEVTVSIHPRLRRYVQELTNSYALPPIRPYRAYPNLFHSFKLDHTAAIWSSANEFTSCYCIRMESDAIYWGLGSGTAGYFTTCVDWAKQLSQRVHQSLANYQASSNSRKMKLLKSIIFRMKGKFLVISGWFSDRFGVLSTFIGDLERIL